MDEGGRKDLPPVPAGYVSLSQLQERWIRMQQEKKLQGKTGEESNGTASGMQKPDGNQRPLNSDEKSPRESLRDGYLRRAEKGGMGSIEVREKEKESAVVGCENAEATNKKKTGRKYRKKRKSGKKKSEEVGQEGNGAEKKPNGGEASEVVETLSRARICDEMKGIQETESASATRVLSRNGVKERRPPNLSRMGHRGGFMRNGRDFGGKLVDELKGSRVDLAMEKSEGTEEGKGSVRKDDCPSVESAVDGLNANEVKLKSGRKGKDVSSLEVLSQAHGLDGRGRDQFQERGKEDEIDKECLVSKSVALEKKAERDISERDGYDGKRGHSTGFRRQWNPRANSGRKFMGSPSSDYNSRYARSRRYRDELKQVWVLKKDNAGVGGGAAAAEIDSSGYSSRSAVTDAG